MKKATAAVLAVVSMWFITQDRSSAQQSVGLQPSSDAITIHATTLAELRTWDAFVVEAARSGALRLRSVERDPALPLRTVERFEQFHQGVRIWGADIVRDSERGVPLSIFGELSPDLTLAVEPSLGEAAAREALLKVGGNESSLLTRPELVILRLDNGDHRLAYTAVVSGSGDVIRVFIDAQTGTELMRYSEIQTQQAAVGTGTGVLGDRKKLSVQSSAGTYIAFDQHRPPIIETFDMRGNLARTKLLFAGLLPYTVSDLASDSDNVWSDVAVVDAHVHVSWTYDYYFKRFGRSGLDGRNGPIDIVVNAVSQQGALSLPSPDLDFAVNAFFCPSCGPGGQGVMFFGSGIPSNFTFDGQTWTYTSGALDVAAHELTHAVTYATSNLVYRNESGALNEAFSDMMGKGVEFFYHPSGAGVGQADYTLGKDVIRAGRAGSLSGLRSMANPALHDQPDHYSRYRRLPATEAGDWGGVHVNSGIPNQAFYLAIEGGTNRTSGLTVQGVGAANREQIEKVFYRAFTLLLPAGATFSIARITTVQAARDLYGAGGAVERAVTQAWDAVGVTNTSSTITTTTMTTYAGTIPAQDNRFYYYAVTMPATGRYQAVLNWSDSSVDLDIMIGRPGCLSYSCMLTRAQSPTRRPEAACVDVRAGEQYWVLIENFSSRSTSYQLSQSISPSTGACGTLPGATAVTTSDVGVDKNSSNPRERAEQLN